MPIIKSFQLYVCNAQGTPIKRLGPVFLNALKNVLDMTMSHEYNLDYDYIDVNWIFSDIIDSPGYIGNALSDYWEQQESDKFSQLLRIAPLSQVRKTIDYYGSYLLLAGNDSGYYAISHDPINSQGYVSGWDLYNKDRQLVESNVSALYFGFPVCNSVGVSNLLYTVENDGKISLTEGKLYTLSISNPYTSNVWAVRIEDQGSVTDYRSFLQWYNAVSHGSDSGDPYDDSEDDSEPGGGQDDDDSDNWDDDSDPNPEPDLPTVSATDTGFITLYNPSVVQLQNLASYMWGNVFDLNTWKKVMADPMDAILGLSIVPVDVPSGAATAVTVGNISTGVSMPKVSSQYVKVDCGSIAIKEHWKSYLDYAPYTKIGVFLPYIGYHELSTDIFMATSIKVSYHIDVLSGACTAFIIATHGNISDVIAQFSGQCSVSIPITSRDFTQTITALATLVSSGVAMGVTGGLSAPVSAAGIMGAATAMSNTAANVMTSKPHIAKSGNVSGANGLMGSQKPYLIIERPKLCLPKSQNRLKGYPSYITYSLGTISGFTQVDEIRLDGIPCTDVERDEILSLLRSGVIL